jgi:hypothetical protein
MESIAHNGQIGGSTDAGTETAQPHEIISGRGPAEKWAEGGHTGLDNAPVAIQPEVSAETGATLESIQRLLLREAMRFRQSTSGSMTVVVRLADGSDILVHFSQRDGGVEAMVRCEAADADRLAAVWEPLQSSLAARRIRLAPLRRASLPRAGVASAILPSASHPQLRKCPNGLPLNRPGWETWA